jgi:hypothetical protein
MGVRVKRMPESSRAFTASATYRLRLGLPVPRGTIVISAMTIRESLPQMVKGEQRGKEIVIESSSNGRK